MSIKDLFKDNGSLLNVSSEEVISTLESKDFIEQKVEENFQFIPDLDFSTASNFARFGLAQEYYERAVEHIYDSYPYDGSEKEITEWKNGLSFLERHVFENEYPKTAGYLRLNSGSFDATLSTKAASSITIISSSIGQYVKFFSGPNGQTLTDGNIYDLTTNRGANLELSYLSGNTVEFWFKADSSVNNTVKSANAAIFDLWNNITDTGSANYSRFFIDVVPSTGKFALTYNVGTNGIERQEFTVTDIYNWHHYAFSVKNSSNKLSINFYKDGNLQNSYLVGTSVGTASLSNLIANIGAYRFTPKKGVSTFATSSNYGQLAGYIDEFRYWKKEKTQKEISRYRFDRIYGGTNTDESNTSLGVYYRFNEGIINNSLANIKDALVLDYSGRVSNGTIINYRLNTRSTSSAIDESGFFDSLEPKEPIIYADNSLVSSVFSSLSQRGEEWDKQNGNAIYKTLPEWISAEDEEISSGELKKLTQIIANYLDKLYLQIKFLPSFQFADYPKEERKPLPFMNTILESNGLSAPDLFIDATFFENIKNRDDTRIFQEKVADLKNVIYKNIYNNLTYIYKSKGTEKSFRNMIRCFGVDDELIKLNVYADNTEFPVQNNKKNINIKKKVINLSTPDSFLANIYNTQDVDGINYGNSFIQKTISSSVSPLPYWIIPLTFETNINFPKKPPQYFDSYYVPPDTELSLFGAYTVFSTSSQTNYETNKAQNYYNFEVSFIKNDKNDTGGYFKFNSILTNEVLTSSYFSDVYDDENWTFAVRLKTPYKNIDVLTFDANSFNSLPSSGDYILEFYGVNTKENIVKNEFLVTSSAIPLAAIKNIHTEGKRFYIGARRQNMTGSLQNYTDILVSSAKFWFDYLSNNEIIEHAKDPFNYGLEEPLTKPYEDVSEKIERINTLGFYWDFSEITSSDNSGKAYVKDIKNISNIYDSLFSINVNYRNPATIDHTIANYPEIVTYKHDLVSKSQIAENLYASSVVNILGESDIAFGRDTRPTNLFWSFEKSMYQVINEDMLNMFAGILNFNTLIGSPINKYRIDYRELNALREKYFSKVQNSPSLERFMEYYKWVDSSIGNMINQLSPAGANISNKVRNMVESHILERPKYEHKLPTFNRDDKNYGQIKGIKELKYNWRLGHAPPSFSGIGTELSQSAYSVWLKERAERNDQNIFIIGSTQAAASRQTILNSLTNETNRKTYKVYDKVNDKIYDRSSYVERKLGRVVDITGSTSVQISSTRLPFTFGTGQQITTSSFVELRPLFSGSSYARISLFNTK